MEKDEFEISKDNNCHTCPFSRIPANFWMQLLKPPFRRRHPFIFWPGLLLCLLLCLIIVRSLWSDDEPGDSDCLALVNIQGPILDASSTLSWIRKLEENPAVKGIVLRVDSPGGGAAASQEIYAALERVKKTKPLVASMGATAASGGLMVSMAAEKIFANPSTVTGSIGVRMDIPQLQGLLSKIGVGQETLVTAPYKDAASYTHPLTPEGRAYLESVLENMHEQFVAIVAKGRNMPFDQAEKLANGKIFTGQEAQKLGLVDEMGGQYEAHQWLAQKTGIPFKQKLLTKPSQRKKLLETLLSSTLGLDISGLLQNNNLAQPAFLYQF